MTDKELGTAAGEIFAKAFTLGYETGRLIPDCGMALTAEQVEDVEALVATANPYSAPADRLRALFPATEPAEAVTQAEGFCSFCGWSRDACARGEGECAPAEPAEDAKPCGSNSVTLGWCKLTARHEGLHTNGTYLWGTPSEPDPPAPAEPAEEVKPIGWYRAMTRKFATAHFGFPEVTGLFEQTHTASDGGVWGYCGGEWELREYPPAPAEPAEEETKAEETMADAWDDGFDAGYNHAGHEHTPSGISIDPPLNPYDERNGWQKPASSPVVPAPTETGPWQRIEDVPEGVLQIKDRHGRTWLMVGGTWRFEWHDGNWHEPHTNINAQAPFVAAAEGS